MSGKNFDDVLTVAAAPCTAGKACDWDIANWDGGWDYAPDYYPTGEEIFASGASRTSGCTPTPTTDALIKLTNTSSSLQTLYNYENYLAEQLPDIWQPETALQFNEVGEGRLRLHPGEPAFHLGRRGLVLLQVGQVTAGPSGDWPVAPPQRRRHGATQGSSALAAQLVHDVRQLVHGPVQVVVDDHDASRKLEALGVLELAEGDAALDVLLRVAPRAEPSALAPRAKAPGRARSRRPGSARAPGGRPARRSRARCRGRASGSGVGVP